MSTWHGRSRGRWLLAGVALAVVAVLLSPRSGLAREPEPSVSATFEGAPPAIVAGDTVALTLRLRALSDAPDVTAEVLPSPGVVIVGGWPQWSGSIARDGVLDVPLSVQFTGTGEYALGARVTNRLPGRTEVGGTSIQVIEHGSIVALSSMPHATMKLSETLDAVALEQLGVAEIAGAFAAGPQTPAAVATTISGTILWQDPEGHTHPVRRAIVQVLDGTTNALVGQTGTNDGGAYSVIVTAESIKVRVYTQDVDNFRAFVFPPGQPTLRYIMDSAVTSLPAPGPINITSLRPVLGSPGTPSNDSIAARAFAVFDAMLTYWFQATGLLGNNMQQAQVVFPNTTSTVSFYNPQLQQMFITRERAYAWDVLGHEFFHFVTNRGAARPIDNNPGGAHSGGSAIGQNGRDRNQGMLLAWSEGLATFMSLALQNSPAAPNFPFPTGLARVGDAHYTTTENFILDIDAERPSPNEGFGSENSVLGVLWDLFDTLQDADDSVTDTVAGNTPRLIWDLINNQLPCNPCDRADRFWTALTNFFGIGNAATLALAKAFALNQMAPEATLPADGASVGGGVSPTFQWRRNGDPSASQRNNQFFLAFARDNFQSHLKVLAVPTLGATSYTPTEAEWNDILGGAAPGAEYSWLVAAERADAQMIPGGVVLVQQPT